MTKSSLHRYGDGSYSTVLGRPPLPPQEAASESDGTTRGGLPEGEDASTRTTLPLRAIDGSGRQSLLAALFREDSDTVRARVEVSPKQQSKESALTKLLCCPSRNAMYGQELKIRYRFPLYFAILMCQFKTRLRTPRGWGNVFRV